MPRVREVEWEHTAREHTPLPMTGSTPDWTEGTPADALRHAGLTYTARAEAPPAVEAGQDAPSGSGQSEPDE